MEIRVIRIIDKERNNKIGQTLGTLRNSKSNISRRGRLPIDDSIVSIGFENDLVGEREEIERYASIRRVQARRREIKKESNF